MTPDDLTPDHLTPDYSWILRLLPVRHPMVLVDEVLEFRRGLAIETAKAVAGSEPCYHGLTDGLPAVRYAYPRSLIVESFGQSAALLWLGSTRRPGAATDSLPMLPMLPMVGRLRKCRFTGTAFPGDVIRHCVRIGETVEGSAFMAGESRVGEQVIFTVGSLVAVERPAASVLADR